MSKNILRFTFAFIAIFVCSVSFAQKKFKVTVKWTAGLVTDKMQVFYHNGIKGSLVDVFPSKNEITISDDFISKYVTINVIVDKNNYHIPAYNLFYVSEKMATITILSGPDALKDSDAKYKTTNAYDINKMYEKYNSFIATAENERAAYAASKGADSTYACIFRKLILKKLEFITLNKNSYFAFRVFGGEIATIQFAIPDSVVDTFPDFYKKTFPEDLRDSPEGKKVTKTLESQWIATHDNCKAPEFSITDISGNKIRFQDLKDKYTIINFWATWCGPCLAELPAIRQIREKYPEDRLAIISVSFDKNYEAFVDALKKHRMDWINVYRDEEFVSNFGGSNPLPKLFLINNKGTIIYNRCTGKEIDYVNLSYLNEILEKELGK